MTDFTTLPENLPIPHDDGAAAHLPGTPMPDVALRATTGEDVHLTCLGPGRTVLYLYPMTGQPGTELPEGWDSIPGARGCTPQACAFRDHHEELLRAGAGTVYGLSSQESEYHKEAVERLHLPFAMLSDPELRLAEMLSLPTFTVEGQRLYKRQTLIIRSGVIEHVFYPVFPPQEHAPQVLEWLVAHPD